MRDQQASWAVASFFGRLACASLPVITLPSELAQAIGGAVLDVAEASVGELRKVR